MKATTALRKIAALKKRIWVLEGGQGASKTFSVLMFVINHASGTPNREIIVASSELTKMRLTVIKDFVNIMKGFNLYDEKRMLGGTLYRFPNGSFIKFIGLDKEDIGKGLRSHVTFVNEANKINFETYRELTSRAKRVIIDYNPNNTFWVHEEVIPREDCDFLRLTYKDNEFLSKEEVAEIESYYKKGYDSDGNEINAYWANKWRVYGLGLEGKIEGSIFQNWTTGAFDETLPFGYCVDFGYKDPFTVTKIAIKDEKMYLKQVIYKSGLSPNMISELMIAVGVVKNAPMVADSADPSMLRQFKNEGYNVYAAVKDKIVNGIRAMQNYEIIIDPTSFDIIKEFQNYVWLDRAGEVPIDDYNHCFIGETQITTTKGKKRIDEIKEGDFVITSSGSNKVLKLWDNGEKEVCSFLMQFDTFSANLVATKDHKIKTTKGWKKISELTTNDMIYLHKPSMERSIKPSKDEKLDSAIQIVRLNHVEIESRGKANVYDLFVDRNHEYFANGILVHNCIDPCRYYEKFYTFKLK